MNFTNQVWSVKFKFRRFLKKRNTNIGEYPQLKLTKFLLKLFGLWPYQSRIAKTCNYLIFVTWTITFVIPTVQGFLSIKNTNVVIFNELMIGFTWIFGSLAQATMLFMRPQWLIRLYEQIEDDWRSITDAEERAILEKFSRQGNTFNFIYIGTSIISYSCFLLLMYMPFYIGINAHRDITEMFPFYSKHWIIYDDARYIQTIVHVYLEALYCALIYITIITIYMASVKHTCGMYAIVSYRLRDLIATRDKILPSEMESDSVIIPKLLNVIEKHRAAIKSAHIVGRTFSRTFFGTQFGVLICLALITFDMSYNVKNVWSICRIVFIGTIFVEHAFYMNYGGQQIIEFSNGVLTSTYFMDWHLLSTNARKILTMIILRSSKTKKLSAGGMILSLGNFTTLMKASWSLATALLSMQKKCYIPRLLVQKCYKYLSILVKIKNYNIGLKNV